MDSKELKPMGYQSYEINPFKEPNCTSTHSAGIPLTQLCVDMSSVTIDDSKSCDKLTVPLANTCNIVINSKYEYAEIRTFEKPVYATDCKVYIRQKKEDKFVDLGVGTLYVKLDPGIGKYRVFVRSEEDYILCSFVMCLSVPVKRQLQNVYVFCILSRYNPPPPQCIAFALANEKEAKNLQVILRRYKK